MMAGLSMTRTTVRVIILVFVALFVVTLLVSASLYSVHNRGVEWRLADRSSAGLLPVAADHPESAVRIFSARTVSWRGIVATHSWIVIKDERAKAYERFDYTAWGTPIWVDRFVADGLWFGSRPEVIFAADGPAAETMIPRIRAGGNPSSPRRARTWKAVLSAP